MKKTTEPISGSELRTRELENSKMKIRVGSPPGIGGADRDRTDDLRLAKPALSQLSYSPEKPDTVHRNLSRVREWWAWEDLNFRPPAYQADALTS